MTSAQSFHIQKYIQHNVFFRKLKANGNRKKVKYHFQWRTCSWCLSHFDYLNMKSLNCDARNVCGKFTFWNFSWKSIKCEFNRFFCWAPFYRAIEPVIFLLPPNVFDTPIVSDSLCLRRVQVPTPTNTILNLCKWRVVAPFDENIRDPIESKFKKNQTINISNFIQIM